jgi:hypothetical protein
MPKRSTVESSQTTNTRSDTKIVTPKMVGSWEAPPFQRPVQTSKKVLALVEQLKATGRLEDSAIVLGEWEGRTYIVDGQHRLRAFMLSELERMSAQVTVHNYEKGPAGLRAMHETYIHLNSHLARHRPDDLLRAMEGVNVHLHQIKSACKFTGFDYIRRGPTSPILSMSTAIRSWMSSASDVPGGCSKGAMDMVMDLTDTETKSLIDFLSLAHEAWGDGVENKPLWAGLNLILCMWLYRNTVLAPPPDNPKKKNLTRAQFLKGLFALAADKKYMNWIFGRSGKVNEDTRNPAYRELLRTIKNRMNAEGIKNFHLPCPDWYKVTQGRRPIP